MATALTASEMVSLTSQEGQAANATHKITLTHENLTETSANTAQTFTFAVDEGHVLSDFKAYVSTPFEDASDAAFNTTALTIGDGGDADRFLASMELNVNGTEIQCQAAPPTTGEYAYDTSDTVDIAFASMTGKALNDIDTGRIDIFFRMVDLRANFSDGH